MIKIDCPEHPGQHQAELAEHGEPYAGIWECPEGASDACEHEETETEIAEQDTIDSQGEHTTYDTQIEVCTTCGCTVER